jgi:flagella basal body P-ring formation protein FlgA
LASVVRGLRAGLAAAVLAPVAALAAAGWVPDATLAQAIQVEVLAAAQADPGLPPQARIAVELGRLDPRLRLAPCEQVERRLAGRAWGATRVELRCARGATRWRVHLPVTVQVLVPGWVAAADLPAGTVIAAGHLREGEVDLGIGALGAGEAAVGGRTLARALAAGEPLRAADLRARQWFAAGDPVQLVAVGRGYRVSGQGQALGPGVEGQRVRVRTETGRVVTGLPVAAGRVEVAL